MKTIANGALYSAVLITALFMPAASFAQSWEPENAWKVDHEDWTVSPKPSSTPKQTPSYNAPNYPSNTTTPNIEVEDIKTSERCKPITIKAKILDYTSISQVFIYYASGNLNYTMLPMKPPPQSPNKFIATLPETATQGDYIDYYIEAFNPQKKLVANSGNSLAPTRIFLTESCPVRATNNTVPQTPPPNIASNDQGTFDDIFSNHTTGQTERSHPAAQQPSSQQALPANPNAAPKPPKAHSQPQTASRDTRQAPKAPASAAHTPSDERNVKSFSDNASELSSTPSTDDTSDPIFQFTVLLGSAFGIIGDRTENCDYDARCNGSMNAQLRLGTGIAWLPFHLRASAMFNLPKHFQIGLYVRGQLIDIVKNSLNAGAKANIDFPEQYNIMVGVAARYLVLWEQPYRLYLGLEFGWGGAYASVDMGTDFNNFRDIYLYKGPLHIAPELGFLWNFHKNVGLALELAVPIVFPERPSAFFDLSLGSFVQF